MTRFILFLFPALLDVVYGGSRFVCMQRMAKSDSTDNKAVAMVLTWWAIGYIISSKACGHFVTAKNSAKFLISSCIAMGVMVLLLIRFDQLGTMYPIMFAFGVFMALFFVPIQVFMRCIGSDEGSSLAKTMSMYTGSWSMGIAMGPFIGGFIWDKIGWESCHIINASLAFVSAVAIYFFARAHKDKLNADAESQLAEDTESESKVSKNPYIKMPDMAPYGWAVCSVGFISMLMLLGVVPKLTESLGLSESFKGFIIALVNMTQSVMAFSMVTGRKWMFRPSVILVMGGVGVASLIGFAISKGGTGLMVSSGMFGIYAAMFCMTFVFYSLVHPTKSSKYLSMNEAIVGVDHIIGPLIGGIIADAYGFRAVFVSAAILIALAVISHAVILKLRCSKEFANLEV